MKKLLLGFLVMVLLVLSCDKDIQNPNQELTQDSIDMSDFYVYTDTKTNGTAKVAHGEQSFFNCFTMENLNRLLNENPDLEKKMYDIEYNTRKFISENNLKPGKGNGGNGSGGNGGSGGGSGGSGTDGITPYTVFSGTNTIPVIFHIIYSSSSENILDSQLNDQIEALQEDFNANNPNNQNIPLDFQGIEANIGVNFKLAGVVRVQSKKRSWRPDDSMKFTSSGGSDVIDPEHYLNIWVVNSMPYMGGYILGYAQFPGGSWSTDGIVLDHRFVGITQYSTGRTATHEIGHWMDLRHIWGDGPCGYDDYVVDTPEADSYNTGCYTYPGPTSCNSHDMFMNFMDYTDDTCMNLFTIGQKARMAATFNAENSFRKNMGITIN
ncbi:zinc metalloprotease [Seonamhaeicola aphaedonensis]|uniref:Pregnancy-associated plasma protein-A n=1 Tax=Seonamhaeicola aphaedonensis TaxID=1461338 RepID=A0A3D9HLW1_9FLAO|nr:zinc metalloprotease [Seonamhaeicola aphaedonensis]RED50463.1 pregnancy-associated plasma protein-A [Seonamhaeicola aphaedonensis]